MDLSRLLEFARIKLGDDCQAYASITSQLIDNESHSKTASAHSQTADSNSLNLAVNVSDQWRYEPQHRLPYAALQGAESFLSSMLAEANNS